MELKGLGNEGRRFDPVKIYGSRSFCKQNMLTLSLGGNLRNWLSHVKFNGLDRFASKSMVVTQSTIVISLKDKRCSIAMEGNIGLKLGEISTA